VAELDSNNIEGILDFFILQTLNPQALQGFDLERRIERIHRMLKLAAERKGKPIPGSLSTALQRLEHEDWLNVEGKPTDGNLEKLYSLTASGREELRTQRTTWTSALTGFIENGGLDDSFRRFLNRGLC
jgi:DNA-binding PadR family transcriptional regulator